LNDELIEGSKAISEVSKFGVKTLETGEKIGGFITRLTGINDDSIIGLLNDRVQFFRWEGQCRMADKYNKKFPKQLMQPIPPKFLIPILENASLEENDDLQDLWVNLLGSWTNAEYKEEKRMTYIDTIKFLTPQDAKILDIIYKYDRENRRTESIENEEFFDRFATIKKDEVFKEIDDETYFLSIDNLIKLRCVKVANTWGGGGKIVTITYLGINFVEACMSN